MAKAPRPLAEQQTSTTDSEQSGCDTEITATTNSVSLMGDSSSSDNNSTVEIPFQKERTERPTQEGEESGEEETKKKTLATVKAQKERSSTTGQVAPGSSTRSPSAAVGSCCGATTTRFGHDNTTGKASPISGSHNSTNNYLTVVTKTPTTTGRIERYYVDVDEKRPLHPPASRLAVAVGVGAMPEGSEVRYYHEYQTTVPSDVAVDVEMEVDDVEVGTIPNQTTDQEHQSNHEPEQHSNIAQDQYPNNSTELQTGRGGQENASSATTNNGAVMATPADNTEQDTMNENSTLQQEDEENPEGRADNDDLEEPPVTSEAANANTNNNESAVNPPTAVQNTSSGQQQQQQRQQRQDLPQAVPVPEPPTFSTGTSLGSSTLGNSNALPSTVVQAQPLENWSEDKEGNKCCRKGWLSPTQWAVGALLFVVLIVVGVVIGVTQAKGSGDDDNGPGSSSASDSPNVAESTVSPSNDTAVGSDEITDAPSFPMFPPFSDRLNFVTVVAIEDPTTPQARANSWMMQDPYRELYDEDRQLQRFSLATLYYSTSGDNWERNDLWLDYERDECQWYNQVDEATEGAICNEEFHMLKLNLSRNNLRGVLPVELFFFPALAALDLSYNGLYGTAPTMFAGARYLQRLVLSSNRLTGQFTAELGFVASQLAVLHNDDNQFTGAVPGLLRLLPQIKELNITGNQYTGTLPSTLMELSDTLTVLEVGSNSITGVLPTVLGLTSRLRVLDVGRNQGLQGTIPSELSALVNLTSLNIEGTGVSGSLPESLCNLQNDGQLQVLADCDGQFLCCLTA